MRKAVVVSLHTVFSFLLASFLWVTGFIDYRDYVIHKGLFALVADYWREFVMVVPPLSLVSGWRGLVNAQRMAQNKVKGFLVVLEVTLMMAALGVIFNTVNFFYYGPYQALSSKLSDYFRFAPVMLLDKVIVGFIFGIAVGLTIYFVNLAGIRLLLNDGRPELQIEKQDT